MQQNNQPVVVQYKPKKKFYQKWWFLILLIFFGIAAIGSSTRSSLTNDNSSNQGIKQQESEKSRDPYTLDVSVSHDNTYIMITNNEPKNIICEFKLNQDYKMGSSTAGYLIKTGQNQNIRIPDFTMDDGTRFNIFETKPQSLRMDCNRVNGDSGTADIFWD